jgi:hypothetical protein
LETTKKQARFETPKFIKRCNCIEMTRQKITWVEGVIKYDHKTIICNKLTLNSKSPTALKNLIKKMKDYSKPF